MLLRMVTAGSDGAVDPAGCGQAPIPSTNKVDQRAVTAVREAPSCGAPGGNRGNRLEFPVSACALTHEEFPTRQALKGLRLMGARARGLRKVHPRYNLGDV